MGANALALAHLLLLLVADSGWASGSSMVLQDGLLMEMAYSGIAGWMAIEICY
jgi:hypothetical protein